MPLSPLPAGVFYALNLYLRYNICNFRPVKVNCSVIISSEILAVAFTCRTVYLLDVAHSTGRPHAQRTRVGSNEQQLSDKIRTLCYLAYGLYHIDGGTQAEGFG
jgi:hypothetical protein